MIPLWVCVWSLVFGLAIVGLAWGAYRIAETQTRMLERLQNLQRLGEEPSYAERELRLIVSDIRETLAAAERRRTLVNEDWIESKPSSDFDLEGLLAPRRGSQTPSEPGPTSFERVLHDDSDDPV